MKVLRLLLRFVRFTGFLLYIWGFVVVSILWIVFDHIAKTYRKKKIV